MSLHSTVTFQCGYLKIDLTPDSRDYVLFSLWKQNEDKSFETIRYSLQRLTCEHLVDLIGVTVMAIRWIEQNCKDITTEDGRHLYFQFPKEINNETDQVDAEPVGTC
jgi:hypothetical protein